jgi:hypothetical protein
MELQVGAFRFAAGFLGESDELDILGFKSRSFSQF